MSYCPACAVHNHTHCADKGCECGDRDHNPTVEVAAAMRRYERPDQHRLAVEQLATLWRRKDGR